MRCQGGIWDFEPSVQTVEDPGLGDIERPTMFLPWQSCKSQIKTKKVYSIHLSGNNHGTEQTFCWSETGIFGESESQADMSKPLLPRQLQVSTSWPGCLSFAQRWYSNHWSNREVLLLLVENYTQYPALLVWNITSWGNFWRPQLELFVDV